MNSPENDTDPQDRQVVRRLAGYFSPYKVILLLALIANLVEGAASSLIALAVKLLMDVFGSVGTAAVQGAEFTERFHYEIGGVNLYDFSVVGFDQVWRLILLVAGASLAVQLIKGVIHFFKEYMLFGVTHRILMRFKQALFDRIVRLPLSFFDREKSGEVLSKVTYDVTQLEGAIRSSIMLFRSIVYAIVYITAMFVMEWSLTLMALAVFPLSGILIKLFGDRIRKISRDVSLNVADYTSFLNEAIGGTKIIKAYGREKDKQKGFGEKIRKNFRFNMKIARLNTLHSPVQELFSSIGSVCVVVFCGYRIISGGMTIGDMAGFFVLLTNAYKPIKSLGETNAIIQRAIASGQRIFDLLDQPDEGVLIRSGSKKPAKIDGDLAFHDVRFSYNDGSEVLKGISLEVPQGRTLALVGPSGGGKSTLVSLIPRFYPHGGGKITLDGIDLSDYDLDFLRSQMAIVPQETILFSGTIEDNIRFSRPDASLDDVIQAARSANAHDFIEKLPDGYAAEVGERGVQLSGGQQQRIALARAILRDPKILILDEATSALDTESESLIQEALEKFRRNRTTLVIAHRLSTVKSADMIAVIDDGRVVESGVHAELFANGGLYRRLCEQQLAG